MDNPIRVQIFVSCPQEVEKEKEIIKRVCRRISDDCKLEKYDIEFHVREWREIIGNIGVLPQVSIDEQIGEYDVYIGILWMKFGTPPGTMNPKTQEPFGSGTEHEFYYAYEQWKVDSESVQLYFFFKKTKRVEQLNDIDQLRRVIEFKSKLQQQKSWVHNFSTPQDLIESVSSIINRYALKLIKQQQFNAKKILVENNKPNATSKPSVDFSSFTKEVRFDEELIQRSLKEYLITNIRQDVFFQEHESHLNLKNAVELKQHIVVLGNAGSGKSMELQQLAYFHSKESSPLIPLYKRLNTYSNENLEDFLPKGWKEAEKSLLLILDGLDEIQPIHFNTAVRKLTSFAENHPTVKIVVSSRTNFYELPTRDSSGTLQGFDVFILNDISIKDVREFVEKKYNISGNEFILEAERRDFLELLQRPFFLKLLAETYAKNGNLSGSRASIYSHFIDSRIAYDKEHFKTTISLQNKKDVILKLLEKVAFVMEALGRNTLNGEEVLKIVGGEENFNLLKYCTAFNKQSDEGHTWAFEHNNIQEYLAARVLSALHVDKIKASISFKPSYSKVKPSWINTLSFLVSIIDGELLKELIEWLVENDPEIVVKFEPDRLPEADRVKIFMRIFNFYKEKDIWLSSNKFENKELARFSQSGATIDFLLKQLESTESSRIMILNALSVLKYLELNFRNRPTAKDTLMDLMVRYSSDNGILHAVMQTLSKLNLNSQDVVENVVSKLKAHKNQHVRAGLYKLINSAALIDTYIEVYLAGIALLDSQEYPEERESVIFLDEEYSLEEGLNLLESPEAIKKLISYFNKPYGSRQRRYMSKIEIFRIMVRKAIEAYFREESIFDNMLTLYHAYGKIYEREFSSIIATFFIESNTQVEAFKITWNNQELDWIEKDFLLAPLINFQVVDGFVKDYEIRDLTNVDAETLHKILERNIRGYSERSELIEILEIGVNTANGEEILKRTPIIDYNDLEKKRSQQNFDLLFNKSEFISEVERVYGKLETDSINFDDLWEYKKQSNRYIEQDFAKSPLSLLRDFTRRDRSISKDEIRNWSENSKNFETYQVSEIYTSLKNYDYLTISQNQKDWIATWTFRTLHELDLKQAVKVRDNDGDSISVSNVAIWAWYFIRKLDLELQEDKALDFTLFTNFENTNGGALFIATLEKYVKKRELEERVTQNLREGIASNIVWENNVLYAIDNQIKSAYDFILQELIFSNRPDYTRARLLKKLHETNIGDRLLLDLLDSITDNKILWTTIELLMLNPHNNEELSSYLLELLGNPHSFVEQKLEASKYLILMDKLEGLDYYIRYVKQHQNVYFEYHNLHFLHHLKNPGAIPMLIELYTLGKDPAFSQDEFNRLDYEAINALYTIGLLSEENLVLVKNALIEFIELKKDEIKDLNFLYHTIDRMEHQFYVSKSQEYNIADAILEANQLK